MSRSVLAPLFVAVAACCLLAAAQAAQPRFQRIRSILTLGDSVADAGLPHGIFAFDNATWPYAKFGYYGGRFSNGPVWEEYLAAQHNLTHVEFAVGGATVNNVPSKISLEALAYLQANPLPKPSLGFITIGANDIMDLFNLANMTNNATATLEYVNNIVDGQIAAARALLAAGIDHFVFIPNTQAVQYTPLGRLAARFQPGTYQQITNLVWVVNKLLTAAVRDLSATVHTGQILNLDMGLELARFDARPSKYGLTNVADACVVFDQLTAGYIMVNGTMQPATLVSTCPNPMQYFFWDILHPTTMGHKLISDFVTRNLKSAGLL